MGLKKAKKKAAATTVEPQIEQYAEALSAKQQFVSAAFDMGWRLALIVLIPVFVGVRLDNRYDTAPSYTLTALFIAIAGASMVVYKTVKEVNRRNG